MNAKEGIIKDYYVEEEVAELLGLAPRTLQKNRCERRRHPPFKKIGGKIYYPKKEFHLWFDSFETIVELTPNARPKNTGTGGGR